MTPTRTSVCIGWPATGGCPTHGEMHGCKKPDGHVGRHECRCGDVYLAHKRRYRRAG